MLYHSVNGMATVATTAKLSAAFKQKGILDRTCQLTEQHGWSCSSRHGESAVNSSFQINAVYHLSAAHSTVLWHLPGGLMSAPSLTSTHVAFPPVQSGLSRYT